MREVTLEGTLIIKEAIFEDYGASTHNTTQTKSFFFKSLHYLNQFLFILMELISETHK